MSADDDPKEMLRTLAAELAGAVQAEMRLHAKKPFPPTIDFDIAKWFVFAVDEYLTGRNPSLESALGLRQRGRPVDTSPSGPEYERAKAAFWKHEFQGQSWKTVADEYPDVDERNLRRGVDRYRGRIINEFAENLTADLTAENKTGGFAKDE
jgi:hypothetical protein